MHELSVAQAIVETAAQSLEPGQRCLSVRIHLGALSGVVEESLRFCFDLATPGTPLENCRLEIEPVAVELYCAKCQQLFRPLQVHRLICPSCQEPSADLRAGRELLIHSLEVSDEPSYSRTS